MKFFESRKMLKTRRNEKKEPDGEHKKTAWKIFPGCFIRYKQNQACFCFSL